MRELALYEFEGLHAIGNGADVVTRVREANASDAYLQLRSEQAFMTANFDREALAVVMKALLVRRRGVFASGFSFDVPPSGSLYVKRDGFEVEKQQLHVERYLANNFEEYRQLKLGVVAVGVDLHEDLHLDLVPQGY